MRDTDVDTTNLTVTVNRNPNAPSLDKTNYNEVVDEYERFGTVVVRLESSDLDAVRPTFLLDYSFFDLIILRFLHSLL